MGLHPEFPSSPYTVLHPDHRWYPGSEELEGRRIDQLLPPLVAEVRRKVKAWRDSGYADATETSRALLRWWFETPHLMPRYDGPDEEFRYYFCQREAIESIIYLTDVAKVRDKYDMIRYDATGAVSAGMFDESWRRFVVKMATGSGKTKVLSLALAWSYFHKLYEPESDLARNFLVIAPNIIVLDRLYRDFKGLDIFLRTDPVLPHDGYEGRDWRSDFQLRLHVQDEVRVHGPVGNIFLTNIHRVYGGDETLPSPDDEDTTEYFLGSRPVAKTTDSRVDLGVIVRDIDELMVLNDEAHHVHDSRSAWFKSIEDIHNRLLQKGGRLAMQIDVTATPRHNNGAIFVQTIADYPLVEAIAQDVVKHPVIPNEASQALLQEQQSVKFTEKHKDFLELGVLEWQKAAAEHAKVGKKAVLFVMTDDTRNCDEVAEYLERHYPDLGGAVLVIHTKDNGEISEASSGKAKEELEKLRKFANEVDDATSRYKAIVSVLMLKEGWDVRNVTTIVGLRAYTSKANILPEQTLGRGLRRMYPGEVQEQVSVIGTRAFMDFVASIQAEGVVLERKEMGAGTGPKSPIVVEVDKENAKKDIEALDIEVPVLSPRTYREYKRLEELDPLRLGNEKVVYREFDEEELREIVFKDIVTEEVTHVTRLDSAGLADASSVLGYFAQALMRGSRLVSGYDVLYGKVKTFVREALFDRAVDLEAPNTLRNLAEPVASKALMETMTKAINALTVSSHGSAEVRGMIRLRDTRPFVANEQRFTVPRKSVFNRIVGDSGFELEFAAFLDECEDVAAFAKNYLAVGFRLDYVQSDGSVSSYVPDFLVRTTDGRLVIVETKGLEDVEVEHKMRRLKQWCEDVQAVDATGAASFVFVDQVPFQTHRPRTFEDLEAAFRRFQE